MSDPRPAPSTRAPAAPRWFLTAALVGLLAYAILLARNFAPVAAGSDSSGYMNSARLLSHGELELTLRPVPGFDSARALQATPLGFFPFKGESPVQPSYPVGLPLHLALAYRLFGEGAGTLLVGVGAAAAAVWLAYLIAREFGVAPWVAAGAAASVGLSPVVLFTSFIPLSDTLTTAWFLVSFYCALRSRESWRWAVGAGVACSLCVLVRPTSVFACAPLALALWHWRSLLGAVLGGLPGLAWLCYYQNRLYGHPLKSGYADYSGWGFDWPTFMGTVHNYGTWLPRLMPLAILGLLVAPVLPWRRHWRAFATLYLSLAALFIFYSSYDISQQAWWYLRFILPGLPGLMVLAAVGLEALRTRFVPPAHRPWTGVVLAVVLLLSPVAVLRRWEREIHVFLLKPYQQLYLDVPAWAKQHLPPDAVIVTQTLSGTFYFYSDLPILRWDQFSAEEFKAYAVAAQKSGRPLYAALLRHEVEEAMRDRLPGKWEKLTEIDICSVWRYVPAP